MYVCICHAVTERDIHEAVDGGHTSMAALEAELGVNTGCGSCGDHAEATLAAALTARGPVAAGQRPVEAPALLSHWTPAEG